MRRGSLILFGRALHFVDRAGADDHSALLLRYLLLVKRALLFLAVLTLGLSCRRHDGDLRVRVLYSAQSPATLKLRQIEREFSFTDARLHDGKPFVIVSTSGADSGALIADKTKNASTDLFVLKSAAELPDVPDLRKSMGDSFSVCGEAVAYIPDWVNEERREGAARFLQYLSTHCR